VKLDQFKALCNREWTQNARGDVKALSLTDASYAELSADVIMSHDPVFAPPTLGPLELVNPVTRSVVKVMAGADSDTAEVDSLPASRTVTCN
jgi:hypothetical protein